MEQPVQKPANPADTDPIMLARKVMSVESRMKGGIDTFYWIAGFSLFNTFSYLSGWKFSFVIGLGITQLIDSYVKHIAETSTQTSNTMYILAFALDVFFAGLFIFFGKQGIKRKKKLVISGMALYALDGFIFLFFQMWIGLLFHAWFLFSLWKGYQAIGEMETLEASLSPGSMAVFQSNILQRTVYALTPEEKKAQQSTRKALWIIILATLAIVITIRIVFG